MGSIIGFLIWTIMGVMFLAFGIYSLLSKKAVGFWANAKTMDVADVKAYNRAMAKLWFVFGIVFILLGLPLLAGQNSPLVFVSVIGVMLESIVTMAVYTTVIEKKYRKKG